MELQYKVQNYEWGHLGQRSAVATFLASADSSAVIEDSKPYAELWIGTHPNGPSLIIERGILLSEYIKDNHDAIGPDVKSKFGVSVPFLLKILSVRKALSIQAHPKKDHAEELHRKFPEIYKDPNHKPELAIALSMFTVLCGFRPIVEIQNFLKRLPELVSILDKEAVYSLLSQGEHRESDKILKRVFESLMTCDKDVVASSLNNLLARLEKEDASIQYELFYVVLQYLHKDYPGDVGCYAPFFMNYIVLKPGEAIFIKPNVPHAYLMGECVECMACSDNVVRAGLTPKLIDVPTLVSMLDYNSYNKNQLIFKPKMEDSNSHIWRPPVPDFAVVKIRVESGDSYNTINRPSPSLIIITSGVGEACDTEPISVRRGVAIFLKASRQLTLTPKEGEHLEAYQAICNV